MEWYLGVCIHIDSEKLVFCGSAYISQSLEAFVLKNYRTYVTQMVPKFFDELMHPTHAGADDNEQYRNMIGLIQFLTHRSHNYCHFQPA